MKEGKLQQEKKKKREEEGGLEREKAQSINFHITERWCFGGAARCSELASLQGLRVQSLIHVILASEKVSKHMTYIPNDNAAQKNASRKTI